MVVFVGIKPNKRLQDGRCDLKHQRDGSNLSKTQTEVLLQNRKECRDHRLHRVVEQMTEADDEEYCKGGLALFINKKDKVAKSLQR